jgi:hypothetical protein
MDGGATSSLEVEIGGLLVKLTSCWLKEWSRESAGDGGLDGHDEFELSMLDSDSTGRSWS